MKIGVLGAGQLGQMLALAGIPLGHFFRFFDPSSNPPAKKIGEWVKTDEHYQLNLDTFLDGVDCVTYEFENIPSQTVERIQKEKPVYPGLDSLVYSQNRVKEKELFNTLGIPTASWKQYQNSEILKDQLEEKAFPCVVKTISQGYDGRGQCVLEKVADLARLEDLSNGAVIVEDFIEFQRELSIIAVVGQNGEIRFWPPAENFHKKGILRTTLSPALDFPYEKEKEAKKYLESIIRRLNHVGVIALELFDTRDGLYVNEFAPRVHNSGHWTMDGSWTSQFENHIRAIAGQPLGKTAPLGLTGMVNILSQHGNLNEYLKEDFVKLYLYGKEERPGRKLGHFNLVENDTLAILKKRFAAFEAYIQS